MSAVARRTAKASRPARKRRLRWIVPLVVVIVLLATAATVFGLQRSHKQTPAKHKQTATSKPSSNTTQTNSTPVAQQPVPTPAAQAPQPHIDLGLSQVITSWQQSHSFTASIVVRELSGSLRTASSNASASVIPASTYKIYVAYAILHGIEQGSYTLSTPTSDGKTIETDLNNMILNSDNDAARTLGFLYGWKNINALLQSQGATATDLYNYVPPSTQPVGDKHTTANDLATILQKLQAGSLLNPTHTQLLVSLMKQQHYRERIPAGVPSGISVADKPGWLSPADGESGYTQNDAGIVYGPKSTYLIVITTNGSGTQPLATLSQQVYNYLEG